MSQEREKQLKKEIMKILEDTENCSLDSSCDCPPQDDIYPYQDEQGNIHQPTQKKLEFMVRQRKAEIIYEKMKEQEYPITFEGLQHFIWDNIKDCIIHPSNLDRSLWDMQYFCMPNLFKNDNKLRCLVFCRLLRMEEKGDRGWSYWKGRDLLGEECGEEATRVLRKGESIDRLNNKAMLNETLAHHNRWKSNLASISLDPDLKADMWRVSPELQEEFPTETELVPDPETGKPVIAPKEKGVMGFTYTHKGWLNMPQLKESPIEPATIKVSFEEKKELMKTEKGRKKFYGRFEEY